MEHTAVSAGLPALGLPFSWGVRCGTFVFLSGQGPVGPDGKVVEGDITLQTRVALENFRKVVDAAGSRMADVVSTTVYLKDLADFAAMNDVYRTYFGTEPKPARATVGADLVMGMKVEIQGIAYIANRGPTRPRRSRGPRRSGSPSVRRR